MICEMILSTDAYNKMIKKQGSNQSVKVKHQIQDNNQPISDQFLDQFKENYSLKNENQQTFLNEFKQHEFPISSRNIEMLDILTTQNQYIKYNFPKPNHKQKDHKIRQNSYDKTNCIIQAQQQQKLMKSYQYFMNRELKASKNQYQEDQKQKVQEMDCNNIQKYLGINLYDSFKWKSAIDKSNLSINQIEYQNEKKSEKMINTISKKQQVIESYRIIDRPSKKQEQKLVSKSIVNFEPIGQKNNQNNTNSLNDNRTKYFYIPKHQSQLQNNIVSNMKSADENASDFENQMNRQISNDQQNQFNQIKSRSLQTKNFSMKIVKAQIKRSIDQIQDLVDSKKKKKSGNQYRIYSKNENNQNQKYPQNLLNWNDIKKKQTRNGVFNKTFKKDTNYNKYFMQTKQKIENYFNYQQDHQYNVVQSQYKQNSSQISNREMKKYIRDNEYVMIDQEIQSDQKRLKQYSSEIIRPYEINKSGNINEQDMLRLRLRLSQRRLSYNVDQQDGSQLNTKNKKERNKLSIEVEPQIKSDRRCIATTRMQQENEVMKKINEDIIQFSPWEQPNSQQCTMDHFYHHNENYDE